MESFEEIAVQFEPMLHKIMNSLSIYQNRDEFYQLGLISLWKALKLNDEKKGTFSSYAYSFVKGEMMNEMTKQARQKARYIIPEEEFWEVIEETNQDYQTVNTSEVLNNLLSSCKTLSSNQRKWLKYTLCDQLTVQEMAEKEQVSLSAVKNWRQGAREKLRAFPFKEGRLGDFLL